MKASKRIHKCILGIGILLLSSWTSSGFAAKNYNPTIDTLSYQQYLQGDWEQLYKTARRAEKDGYGFYYFYLRAAFACYYTERYTLALVYFNKAGKIYEINDTAKDLQYLASLRSNSGIAAAHLYQKLPEASKKYYRNPKTLAVSSVGIESGYNFNANFKKNSTKNISGTSDLFGEEWLLKETFYNSISLSHHILPQLDLYHAYSNIIVNRQQRFEYINNLSNQETSFDIQAIQHQYFFNPIVHLNDNWSISPAFTGIWIKSDSYIAIYDSINYDYSFAPNAFSDDQYIISLNASYKNSLLWVEVASNYLLSEDLTRWQAGLNALFYPLRKKNFYLGGGIHYLQDPKGEDNFIGNLKVGGKIKELSMSTNYSYGDMKDYTEANGLIVYNTLEHLQSKLGAQLSYPFFNNQLYVSLYYSYLIYTAKYYYLEGEEDLSSQTESYNINNHSFIIGVNYYF